MTQPCHSYRYGNVSVAIWLNQSSSGIHYNVTVKRSFKNKESGEWQSSDSFSDYDLPALSAALLDAYSWVQEKKRRATTTLVADDSLDPEGQE